jgi:DNA-binding CsgD family transcriptional regulator
MDFHQLTARQRRILELVVSGKTNKEIAAIVRISENTVEYHLVKRIYPALGVRTRGAAASVYLKLAAAALRKAEKSHSPILCPVKDLGILKAIRLAIVAAPLADAFFDFGETRTELAVVGA